MKLTRKQVIDNLIFIRDCMLGDSDENGTWRVALSYAISSLKTDEAYQIMYEGGETFTKADMVAMLTELQLEIEEMSGLCTEIHGDEWNEINTVHSQDVLSLIQQKIDKLRGEESG